MTKNICDAYLGGEAFNSSLDVGWGKTQSIQCRAEKKIHIQDRDFDLNTYIMYLILIFELQELSMQLQSLMFFLIILKDFYSLYLLKSILLVQNKLHR